MIRLGKCRVLAITISLGAFAAGCTNNMTAPSSTLPDTVTNTPAPPPSSPSSFTLKGRVTESMPTVRTGISGAVIRISAGANAGHSVTADSYGYYTFSGVEAGSTLNVSANGYMSALKTVNSDSDLADFQLSPVPKSETHSMVGSVSKDTGTCSDGASMRPCNIMTIAIHNAGPLDATLTADGPDLDLSLFRTNDPQPIARSATAGSSSERIVLNLEAGASYELHVTFASGIGSLDYQLKVTHMN